MERPAAARPSASDVENPTAQPVVQPACPLQLGKQEVHIWQARLDVGSSIAQRLSTHLSQDEVRRAERFVLEKDRTSFKVARGILRELLRAYLQQPAAAISFETGTWGKPALSGAAQLESVRFNVSHSYGLALYAFTRDREIGIDVEKIRPEVAFEGIEDRYFSAREVQELRSLPHALRPQGFFLCWTRKEAYIKARGEGLQIPLDSFDVSLIPGAPAVLNSTDCDKWGLTSLNLGPDFAGAVVVEGRESKLQFWEWRPTQDYA